MTSPTSTPADISFASIAFLPSWSSGDREDATTFSIEGKKPLAELAADPADQTVEIHMVDTRDFSRVRSWGNDRVPVKLLVRLSSLTDAMAGIQEIGTPVEYGAPLEKNLWRVGLGLYGHWDAQLFDLTDQQVADLQLEGAESLIRRPFGV